jgi:hypothetical protein
MKPMTDDKRKATGAHFVTVAAPPVSEQRVSAAESVNKVQEHHRHSGRMTQIIDRSAADHVIDACRDFCNPERKDVQKYQITLTFSKEIKAGERVDLTLAGKS